MASITVEVKLDPKERDMILKAVQRIESETIRMVDAPGEGLKWLGKEYLMYLKMAILTQKYANSYKAYSTTYATWKVEEYGSTGGFWKLSGDLLRSLHVYNPENALVIAGVPGGVLDSGGKSYAGGKKKHIAMYGAVMEEGLRDSRAGVHPARPVFEPVFKSFTASQSLAQRGTMWRIGDKILLAIGEFWRPS